MDNPFLELRDLLSELNVTDKNLNQSRRVSGGRYDWEKMREALVRVMEAEDFIAELSESDEYETTTRRLWYLLFQPEVSWAQRPHKMDWLPEVRSMMTALGATYNLHTSSIQGVSRESTVVVEIEKLVGEIKSLVAEVPDSHADLRESILSIIESFENELDRDDLTMSQFREQAIGITGASMAAVRLVPQESGATLLEKIHALSLKATTWTANHAAAGAIGFGISSLGNNLLGQ